MCVCGVCMSVCVSAVCVPYVRARVCVCLWVSGWVCLCVPASVCSYHVRLVGVKNYHVSVCPGRVFASGCTTNPRIVFSPLFFSILFLFPLGSRHANLKQCQRRESGTFVHFNQVDKQLCHCSYGFLYSWMYVCVCGKYMCVFDLYVWV